MAGVDTLGEPFNTPEPATIPAGFGFVPADGNTRGISAALDQAQTVATNLRGTINQHITNSLANSAVSTDVLQRRVAENVAGSLATASTLVQQLQVPIAQQIIGKIGTSLENTIPLGVVPPAPETVGTMPACVQIKTEAQQGVISAAIQYYLVNGGTLGLPLGTQQIQAKQFIQKCLADNPSMQSRVLTALQDQDTNPISMQTSYQSGAAQMAEAQQMPGQPGIGGQSIPQSIQYYPQGNPVGITINPQTVAIGAPTTATLPGGGKGAVGLPPSGATNPLTGLSLNIAMPSPIQSATCALLQSIGYAALSLVAPTDSTQQPYLLGYVSGGAMQPTMSWLLGEYGQYNGQAGFPFQFAGGPPGFGGQGFCPMGDTTLPPAPPTLPPTLPPQPTTCPPPVINVTCPPPPPPPTPPTPETKPPKSEPCKYDLYCTTDNAGTLIIYAVKSGLPPHEANDTMLASGDPAEWIVYDAANKCGANQQQDEPQEGTGADIQPFPVDIAGCTEFGAVPGVQLPNGVGSLSQIIGLRNADGTLWSPFPDGGGPPGINVFSNLIVTFFAQIIDNLSGVVNAVADQSGCATGEQFALMGTDIILKLWQQWAGGSLDSLTIPNDQRRHFLCPTILPSSQESTAAYLGNQISQDTLQCWVRADNRRWPEYAAVVDAQRSKLAPQQMAFALRRQLVGQQTYNDYIRESGFIRDFEAQLNYDLTAQIPPPSDIVRMMVRDAADEALVAKFSLDDQFGQKYQGQLKTWGDMQGIDPLYMQYLWRSHWSIPAPGQLSAMLHRLSRLQQNDPAYVDQDTIRAALIQQDIAPFWVDKFIAISYSPLTRIDARRAYEIGAIDATQLKEAYLNLGYAPADADTLVSFNEKNIARTFMRRPEIKQLAAGEITNTEFDQAMSMFGATDTIVQQGIQYSALIRAKNTRTQCVAAAKKRFLGGDYDSDAATTALTSLGIQGDAVGDIVAGWQCELHNKGKVLSAAQAISLYQDQIINETDLLKRLTNVGYSQDDAVILVRQQLLKSQRKMAKDQITQMKQEQAAQDKLARQLARQAQQQARAQQRQAQLQLKAQEVKELNEKRLIEAALKISANTGMAAPAAILWTKGLFSSSLSGTVSTQSEIIAAILLAAQDTTLTTTQDIAAAVSAALLSIG